MKRIMILSDYDLESLVPFKMILTTVYGLKAPDGIVGFVESKVKGFPLEFVHYVLTSEGSVHIHELVMP